MGRLLNRYCRVANIEKMNILDPPGNDLGKSHVPTKLPHGLVCALVIFDSKCPLSVEITRVNPLVASGL